MSNIRIEAERNGVNINVPQPAFEPYDLLSPSCVPATVGFSIGTQYNFGEVKVTAHVTLQCNQKAVDIERAGELAFAKAVEFMNNAMALLVPK